VHHESILDLIKRQQFRGEPGISWGTHQELVAPVAFADSPYHYCAMTARKELAAILYRRGVPCSRPITAVFFTSGGVHGDSQWLKSITFSSSDVAMLAGNKETSVILRNIERGIPFEWSRENHHLYPEVFRRKAREMVEQLARLRWFASLPGSFRREVVDRVMQAFARETYWSLLPADAWDAAREPLFLRPNIEPKVLDRLALKRGDEAADGAPDRAPAHDPQYHYRWLRGGRAAVGRRIWRWPRAAARFVSSSMSVVAVRRLGVRGFFPGFLLALATAGSTPLSAMLLLSSVVCGPRG